ncbi:MAG: hypothetical protein J7621_03050 [Niastella sp.]|nr:hypothetical protein [Niastella sp.]
MQTTTPSFFKKHLMPVLLLGAGILLLAYGWFFRGAADLKVKIKPATYIMPAAYKVYANPEVLGGRYNLFKAVIENPSGEMVQDMKVEYRIPKYIDEWTEAPAAAHVLPGQTVVAMGYPAFDQKITEKNSQSKEKAEVRITWGPKGNREEVKETFSFTMMAAGDFAYTDMPASEIASFADMMQNNPLSVCFITAEDPAVRYYTGKIQQKILKGETAGVTHTAEEGVRFLKGIYEATLRSGMVYSSTQAVPSSTGDVQTLVQRIRLPREVISNNTGLCIELSFLYASIMRNAGLDPVVFYIPGHAYPGFKLNGQYYAIEATSIGGAGLGGSKSADEALQIGMKELQEFFQRMQMGDDRYYMVDVTEGLSQGIIPMELKEDAFTRQKIDEVAANWENGGGVPANNVVYVPSNNGGGGNTGGGNDGGGGGNTNTGFVQYSRNISFAYPQGSKVINNPNPQVPVLITMVNTPGQAVTAQVYEFQNASGVNQALESLREMLYQTGQQISYQTAGSHNGYTLVNGVTNYNGNSMPWIGGLRNRNGHVEGLIIGIYNGNQQLAQQILGSLR